LIINLNDNQISNLMQIVSLQYQIVNPILGRVFTLKVPYARPMKSSVIDKHHNSFSILADLDDPIIMANRVN
jgi:hypothetical protein